MTSDCQACAIARTDVHTAHYTNGCPQCNVRSLAQSPAYFDSMQADAMTPAYRSALQFFFGNEWMQAHGKVKTFYALLKSTEAR